MDANDFCELSVEQEEYLVELLCTRGACTVDWLARELDELCRDFAKRAIEERHGTTRAGTPIET